MRLVDDRGRARAFGGVADAYDRARPSYPIQAVRWLLEPGCLDVIDIGAGTGKLTSMLVAEGHRVVAVEPLAPMRAKLTRALPAVRVLAGRAEDIPAADRCADVVVVGQAFHWFDAAPALKEIAHVLRPGGILGLLWNFRDRSQAWMRELAAVAGQDGLPEGWTRELERFARVTAVERRDFGLTIPSIATRSSHSSAHGARSRPSNTSSAKRSSGACATSGTAITAPARPLGLT